MSYETKMEWACVFFSICLAIAIVGVGSLIGITLAKYRCSRTAELLGYKCKYEAVTGCIVEVNGKKILLENLRGVQ